MHAAPPQNLASYNTPALIAVIANLGSSDLTRIAQNS